MTTLTQPVMPVSPRRPADVRFRYVRPPGFDERMLELHSALEVKELWSSTRKIMHAAIPMHFMSMCLLPFFSLPGTIFRERYPFTDPKAALRLNQVHPVGAAPRQ